MSDVLLPERPLAAALDTYAVRARFFFEGLGQPYSQQSSPADAQSIGPTTMRGIVAEIAERDGIPVALLRGAPRTRFISDARQEAMWRMYQTGRFSLPQIGAFLGGRDHTTILHGVRAHAERTKRKAP